MTRRKKPRPAFGPGRGSRPARENSPSSGGVSALGPGRDRGGGRRVDAATVAAVAVLLLALVAAAWIALGGSPPGHTSQGLTWRQVKLDAADGHVPVQPVAAAAAGSGWVGICEGVGDAGGRGYCTSPDGLRWSADWPSWMPKTDFPSAIAKASAGYALVGSAGAGGSAPAAWFSDDGRSWQAASISGSAGAGMVDVVAGPGGFLAIGWNEAGGQGGQSSLTSLWRSSDGRSWAPLAGLPGGQGGQGALFSTGTAFLVAPLDETSSPGVLPLWRSEGGETWERAALSGDQPVAGVDDIVALGDGSLLATVHLDPESTDSPSLQRLLKSRDDGRTWAPFHVLADDGPVALGSGTPATLVRSGGILLGLTSGNEIDATAVAVSDDGGATWVSLVDPVDLGIGDTGTYDAPIALGDSVFVAEAFADVTGSQAVFWVGRAEPAGAAPWLPGAVTIAVAAAAIGALGFLLWRWRPSRIGRRNSRRARSN